MDLKSHRILHCSVLACVVLVAYAYFAPPRSPENFGTNNAVRFYLTKSLVRDGSFTIEKYYQGGIDAASYNGHFYSGKAPCASFLAVPVYWAFWKLIGDMSDRVFLYLAQLFVISAPSVILALLMHGFLRRFEAPEWCIDLLVIGYSLGTMAFPYSTQFVGHQLAAVFLFCSFLALLRWRRESTVAVPPSRRFGLLLLAGLWGGLAVAADYQVLLILGVIFIFTGFSFRRPGQLVIFALGCVPGVFLVLLYNYACFGAILSFPYAHEAMPIAREVQSQGLFGVKMPRLAPFFMLLFGPLRGLFFVSPFLLLSMPGLYYLFKGDGNDFALRAGIGGRRLFWLCLIAIFGYVLFNSSYGAWAGGAAYGPRFLVPVLPFAMIPIAVLLSRRLRGFALLSVALVIYSMAFHFIGTAGGPLAHEYLRNPVRDFLLPSMLRGNIRPNLAALSGLSPGASAVLFAAIIACGVFLFIASGRRREPLERAAPGLSGPFWWWLSAAAFLVMAGLFIFHRTEETAYRYAVLGHSYDVAGDDDAAIRNFERSLRMDPKDALVVNDLTRLYLRRGEYRKAQAINAMPRSSE